MILALTLWTAMTCVPVEGDRILAGDLAAEIPAFAKWAPDTELGYAPAPGLRRVFRAAELERLARRQSIDAGPMADVCVEHPVTPLSPEVLQAALAAAAGDPQARIRLIDWSRYPVPRGSLEFPRTGAIAEGTGPEARVLWKGFVRYGKSGRFSVWARARIETRAAQVSAREALPAGHAIAAGQLNLETVTLSPFGAQPAHTLAEVIGRIPRRPVPAGSPVFLNQLDVPPDIHSGDTVLVRVTSGLAGLALDGVAGGDGRRGDLIPVRNPATGRTFRARVESAGKVSVAVPFTQPQPPTGEK